VIAVNSYFTTCNSYYINGPKEQSLIAHIWPLVQYSDFVSAIYY